MDLGTRLRKKWRFMTGVLIPVGGENAGTVTLKKSVSTNEMDTYAMHTQTKKKWRNSFAGSWRAVTWQEDFTGRTLKRTLKRKKTLQTK